MNPAALAYLGVLLVAPSLDARDAAAVPPNLLFLLADDLGYGDLACYGHPRIKTPNLDRLAREGTRFGQFYVSMLCSPTRASVVTGQFPSRWRIFGHFAALTSNRKRGMPNWLDAEAPSMPRALQRAGYWTAHFGKWHLGGGSGSFRGGKLYINDPAAPPVASYGFDAVRATFGNAPTWKRALPVDKPHELYPYDEPEWQTWSSRAIADSAIEFLEDHARRRPSRPFLAHVFFKDTHTPMKPTDEMRAPYGDVPEPAQTHYAMATFMDGQMLLMDPDGARLALYNLADDLSEQHDVAGKNPQRVETLRAKLAGWYRSLPTEGEGPAATASRGKP